MILRKILLGIVLIITILLCYNTAVNGLTIGNFKIPSYAEVEDENTNLETKISELTRKNTTDFESASKALDKAIKDYKLAKENYEAVAPTLENMTTSEIEVDLGIKPYDVEYLLVKVGNYATDQDLNITFNIIKSGTEGVATGDTNSNAKEYYVMADIQFILEGEYNNIIEFMYSIEGDDELRFEINDFQMKAADKFVQAKFTVRSIPVNKSNLIKLYEPAVNSAVVSNTVNNTTSGGINYSNPLNIDKNNVGGVSQEVKNSMNKN
jgi:hypothetical protein